MYRICSLQNNLKSQEIGFSVTRIVCNSSENWSVVFRKICTSWEWGQNSKNSPWSPENKKSKQKYMYKRHPVSRFIINKLACFYVRFKDIDSILGFWETISEISMSVHRVPRTHHSGIMKRISWKKKQLDLSSTFLA